MPLRNLFPAEGLYNDMLIVDDNFLPDYALQSLSLRCRGIALASAVFSRQSI